MEIWVKTRKAFCQNWIKDIMPVIIQFFIAILKLQTDTGNHKDTVKICLLICIKIGLSRIYTRQDVTLVWTRRDFLYVAGKSKFLVKHFLMAILSRSWSFHIRTWTRNAKLPRLIRFISFKIWHRYAPRNATRNATIFWISRFIQKVTSGSYQGDVLMCIDWAFHWSLNGKMSD